MQTENNNVPDGYIRNAQGHMVPVVMINDIAIDRDELVRDIMGNAELLRDRMA